MELITAHTNADFDTLASMIAAKKLYPKAVLAFSGSLEKALEDALLRLELPYEIKKAKEINLKEIKKLILVDTHSKSRIGRFSEILTNPKLVIHIYDHHPIDTDDEDAIRGIVEVIKKYGSTTTILALILKKKKIKLTTIEATILMAGIYEDTGSLSFSSTTTKDFAAASFLLSSGARLKEVSELLNKEMSSLEVQALSEFIESETTYSVGGYDVIIAEAFVDDYHGDISSLAEKLSEIESMESLFLLADVGRSVHVVARSNASGVNVGEILKKLGGGGHPHAASCTIKGLTLIETRERVLEAIKKSVLPKKTAHDIMTAPAITIDSQATLSEASLIMRRYNVNSLPVLKGEKLLGVISRQVASKASYHKLGKDVVSNFMTTDITTAAESTSVDDIREALLLRNQRILPVLKHGQVTGVITRTDLIKIMHEELTDDRGRKDKRRLKTELRQGLPKWALAILHDAGSVADSLGYKAYVVGGLARDLLLKRENLDIDIVIEGDGIKFAKKFANENKLQTRTHDRFHSAVIIFPDGYKIDVATARLEYYERPGALPTIERSSLKLDLFRRDFTINTLAISINPENFGELIDFFGAEKDIRDKTIRTLHSLSFVEDPTRALRAVRFSERYGFKIGKHTLNLIKNTIKKSTIKAVSGKRLRDELQNILMEENPGASLKRLDEIGILSMLSKNLRWDKYQSTLFKRTKETLAWFRILETDTPVDEWAVQLLSITDQLNERELLLLVKYLSISNRHRLSTIKARPKALLALKLISERKTLKKSTLYSLLIGLPIETLLYLMSKAARVNERKKISDFISRLRHLKCELTGRDLKRLGIKEGPEIGKTLNILLKAKIDEKIENKDDEIKFVKKFINKTTR
jgi:tRNA nucleotidyltransferase (CCA-adding enzyme)